MKCARTTPMLLVAVVALAGCANRQPPYQEPEAPQHKVAPATRNGVPVPSLGSGYNPETGTEPGGSDK
jgi:hypothetical protein